jgi:hypothetical protein
MEPAGRFHALLAVLVLVAQMRGWPGSRW